MNADEVMGGSGFLEGNGEGEVRANDATAVQPGKSISRLNVGAVGVAFKVVDELFMVEGEIIEIREERMLGEFRFGGDDEGSVEGTEGGGVSEEGEDLRLVKEHERVVHVGEGSGDSEGSGGLVTSSVAGGDELVEGFEEVGEGLFEGPDLGGLHEEGGGGGIEKGREGFMIGVNFEGLVGRVGMGLSGEAGEGDALVNKEIGEFGGDGEGITGKGGLEAGDGLVDEGGEEGRLGVCAGQGIENVVKS